MAMNEARVRIMTNNTEQPVFSPQDVLDCSPYSQGTFACINNSFLFWLLKNLKFVGFDCPGYLVNITSKYRD